MKIYLSRIAPNGSGGILAIYNAAYLVARVDTNPMSMYDGKKSNILNTTSFKVFHNRAGGSLKIVEGRQCLVEKV